jgi:allantoinase
MTNPKLFDTLISGGTVVTETGVKQLELGIHDGKIAALLRPGTHAEAKESIDATGKHILPGAIDIHFHVRAPAYPERGTVASETRAAAAGGVTTLFEMPISKPCCATPEIFRQRREHFSQSAYVNFGLYGAPGLLNADYIAGMIEEGAIGFKIFMTAAPKGRDDEFVGLCLPTAGQQYEALKLLAKTDLVTVIHAEDNGLLEHFSQQLKKTGRNDALTHGESRPPIVEALAIAEILTMNENLGAKLHIAHVSSHQAVKALQKFQATMDVTGETCPQYLLFSEEHLAKYGSFAKINPPLRTPDDQQALWTALQDGTLMAVTTDHSPFAVEEKEKAKLDFWAAPPGAPGIEELVPGILDAVAKRRLTLEQAVDLISTNGAKRFGLYPQKGVIAPGSDADVIIVDLEQSFTIDKSKLFTQARLCDYLYDGMTFQGKVLRTMLAGKTIFNEGEVTGKAGWGQFVRPQKIQGK